MKNKTKILILFLLVFSETCKAQKKPFEYKDYGKIIFNYADSARLPKNLFELMPIVKDYDSVRFNLAIVFKGDFYKRENISYLDSSFFVHLSRTMFVRTGIFFSDVVCFKNTKREFIKNYAIILDEKLRFREWIQNK